MSSSMSSASFLRVGSAWTALHLGHWVVRAECDTPPVSHADDKLHRDSVDGHDHEHLPMRIEPGCWVKRDPARVQLGVW
jgi:hypothetical protein